MTNNVRARIPGASSDQSVFGGARAAGGPCDPLPGPGSPGARASASPLVCTIRLTLSVPTPTRDREYLRTDVETLAHLFEDGSIEADDAWVDDKKVEFDAEDSLRHSSKALRRFAVVAEFTETVVGKRPHDLVALNGTRHSVVAALERRTMPLQMRCAGCPRMIEVSLPKLLSEARCCIGGGVSGPFCDWCEKSISEDG